MKHRYPRTFPADEASSWRRIRRYAVPRWMIERATERRLAGDWRGACAAANVDVDFGLADIARQYGQAIADALEEDLWDFVPDLLRWHLPRYLRGRTTIQPDRHVILARYGDRAADGPYLYVSALKTVDGPQRLTLCFGEIDRDSRPARRDSRGARLDIVQNWATARHLWDARQADELRERCGGGERAPFHNADGTPRDVCELPITDPGPGDPAGRAEWAALLHDRGEVERACGVAEIRLDDTPPQFKYGTPPALLATLAKYPLALTRLEQEVRRLDTAGFGSLFWINHFPSVVILFDLHPYIGFGRGLFHVGPVRSGLRVRLAERKQAGAASPLPEACWRRLPDLDLLRFGDITPEVLHPLVSASLFPGRAVGRADGPPDLSLPSPVRVRCRGEWHEVCSADGGLQVPHSAEEQRRERAMRAFGGRVAGCFATQQAWTSGTGRLPRALRDQRREFFSRVQHGDTSGVLRLLDAGVDPRVRDARQRTLLHLLPLLDHQALLPRLLEVGLDIEAQDHHQRTPLHVAVGEGPAGLVRALLDEGARTDVVDSQNRSLAQLIVQHKRKELRFLKEAVERDHPDIIVKYPTWGDLDD